MMLDRAALIAKREDIVKQRDNAFAVHQQAVGALTLLDHLIGLASENKDGLTLDELAASLGADSAEIMSSESDGG